jgi:hypothetical protein
MTTPQKVFGVPRVMRRLDFFYLAAGILHELHSDMFPEETRLSRTALLIMDQQPDIPAPGSLPVNWPVAIIRNYVEYNEKAVQNSVVTPARVGVNQDSVGLSEGVVMDQNGILAYEHSVFKKNAHLKQEGFYLVFGEAGQTSLVPSLGAPDTFKHIRDVLDLLPKGMLDVYYTRQVTQSYEETCMKEEYNEDILETRRGLGMNYTNWELANALVAAACMTWIQYQKVLLDKPATQEGSAEAHAEQASQLQRRGETEVLQHIDELGVVPSAAIAPSVEDGPTTPAPLEKANLTEEEWAALTPNEQAARALGVDVAELDELAADLAPLKEAGTLQITDVTVNPYETLDAYFRRTSAYNRREVAVSEDVITLLKDYIHVMTQGDIHNLPGFMNIDLHELQAVIPELQGKDLNVVAEAARYAIFEWIKPQAGLDYGIGPRYDGNGALLADYIPQLPMNDGN